MITDVVVPKQKNNEETDDESQYSQADVEQENQQIISQSEATRSASASVKDIIFDNINVIINRQIVLNDDRAKMLNIFFGNIARGIKLTILPESIKYMKMFLVEKGIQPEGETVSEIESNYTCNGYARFWQDLKPAISDRQKLLTLSEDELVRLYELCAMWESEVITQTFIITSRQFSDMQDKMESSSSSAKIDTSATEKEKEKETEKEKTFEITDGRDITILMKKVPVYKNPLCFLNNIARDNYKLVFLVKPPEEEVVVDETSERIVASRNFDVAKEQYSFLFECHCTYEDETPDDENNNITTNYDKAERAFFNKNLLRYAKLDRDSFCMSNPIILSLATSDLQFHPTRNSFKFPIKKSIERFFVEYVAFSRVSKGASDICKLYMSLTASGKTALMGNVRMMGPLGETGDVNQGAVLMGNGGLIRLKANVLESFMSFMELFEKNCYIKLRSAQSFKQRGIKLAKNNKNITNDTDVNAPPLCNYSNENYHKFENVMYLLENGAIFSKCVQGMPCQNYWKKTASNPATNRFFAGLYAKVKQPIFNFKKFKDYLSNYVSNYLTEVPSLKQQSFWMMSVLNKYLINNGYGMVDVAGGSFHQLIGEELYSVITADYDFKIYIVGETEEIRKNREYVIKQWFVEISSQMNNILNHSPFFDILLSGEIFFSNQENDDINEWELTYVCDVNINKSYDGFINGQAGKGLAFSSRGSESFFVPLYSKDFNLMFNYAYKPSDYNQTTTNKDPLPPEVATKFSIAYLDLVFKNIRDHYEYAFFLNESQRSSNQSSKRRRSDVVQFETLMDYFPIINTTMPLRANYKPHCKVILRLRITPYESSLQLVNVVSNVMDNENQYFLGLDQGYKTSGLESLIIVRDPTTGKIGINDAIGCYYLLRMPFLREIQSEVRDLIVLSENRIGRLLSGKTQKDDGRIANINAFVAQTGNVHVQLLTGEPRMMKCYYQFDMFNCPQSDMATDVYGKIKRVLNNSFSEKMKNLPRGFLYYELQSFMTMFYWANIISQLKYVEFKYDYHVKCATNMMVVPTTRVVELVESDYNEYCKTLYEKMCNKLRLPTTTDHNRATILTAIVKILSDDFEASYPQVADAGHHQIMENADKINKIFDDMVALRKKRVQENIDQSRQRSSASAVPQATQTSAQVVTSSRGGTRKRNGKQKTIKRKTRKLKTRKLKTIKQQKRNGKRGRKTMKKI